jgi:hypothetical protein
VRKVDEKKLVDEIYEKYPHNYYIKLAIDGGRKRGDSDEQIISTIIHWQHRIIEELESEFITANAMKKEIG